jgi:hypothetical protein
MFRFLKFCALLTIGLLQCESAEFFVPETPIVGAEYAPVLSPLPIVTPTDDANRACQNLIRRVQDEPEVAGAGVFDQRRLEILTRAKAEPVMLTHEPTYNDPGPPRALVLGYRRMLAQSKHPWGTLEGLLPKFEAEPSLGREVLLRDGYLYSDNPEMAFALVGLVSAEHLFGHDHIWIKRGEATFNAEKRKGFYVFTDGPNEGERVRLLLLDRIGTGPVPEDSLVRDFRSLKYRLHFDRARITRFTENHVLAELRYGNLGVSSVLSAKGAHLELECEIVNESQLPLLELTRADAKERQRVVQGLRVAMQGEIHDQLPFDEPRREWGLQLDGKLRKNWYTAYMKGDEDFGINGDHYFVYNAHGGVLVPEVCVDFLTDTFERASGTWWTPKGSPPGRILGKLNFDEMDILERAKLRRVPGFIDYARNQPDKFDVLDIPQNERVPLGSRQEMLELLTHRLRDFQPGDVLVIRGRTPWDAVEMHYHSFFVYESDPVSGVPLALVGNAGRPSVRYWEVEARRTPERELWYRVRPSTRWLASILAESPSNPEEPPPISPRGNSG